ncbi:hypothetical protein FA15DRAFT_11747 [Coprinopsis marcescibilis]|uniref:Uncharacterized protein n=1 Tax=Coprinopsis marcescibilis TaxID=230819 RepID=A0A5C3LBR6_COPMA|nr:hypothetical protein FA15DRAFT_11747 [Coprinopsis marcescibilis]
MLYYHQPIPQQAPMPAYYVHPAPETQSSFYSGDCYNAPAPANCHFQVQECSQVLNPIDLNCASPLDGHYSYSGYAQIDQSTPQHWTLVDNPARNSENMVPTFPTPSELLVELSNKSKHAQYGETDYHYQPAESSWDASEIDTKPLQDDGHPGFPPAEHAVYSHNVKVESPGLSTEKVPRRRTLLHQNTQDFGVMSTDPETISSHDKKRHYLECLEKYVLYLLELIGPPAPAFRRVQPGPYRGLSSPSIRTLLVHMEDINRKLNLKTIAEEQRFLALRDEVMSMEATLQDRDSKSWSQELQTHTRSASHDLEICS